MGFPTCKRYSDGVNVLKDFAEVDEALQTIRSEDNDFEDSAWYFLLRNYHLQLTLFRSRGCARNNMVVHELSYGMWYAMCSAIVTDVGTDKEPTPSQTFTTVLKTLYNSPFGRTRRGEHLLHQ